MSDEQIGTACQSGALAVELATPPDWTYSPGDTVIGTIFRREHIVSPRVTIIVRLRGLASTYWVVYHGGGAYGMGSHGGLNRLGGIYGAGSHGGINQMGHNRQVERFSSNFDFFRTDDGPPTQALYEGPLHVDKDGSNVQSWSFALTVPTSAGLAVPYNVAKPSYLPLTPDELPLQQPPGSLITDDYSVGKVRYFVEAFLRLDDEDGNGRFGYTPPQMCHYDDMVFHGFRSHIPFIMRRPPVMPVSPRGYDMQTWDSERSAVSYRLLPTQNIARLSLLKRSKQFMKSSSVRKLVYTVRVGAPSRIHLDHPAWFPLTLQVIPDDLCTSELIRNVPQKAALCFMEFTILTNTMCLGTSEYWHNYEQYQIVERHPIGLKPALKWLPNNADYIAIPVEFGAGSEPTDLGASLKLRWTSKGFFTGDTCLAPLEDFKTAFTTYNIKRRYNFQLKFRLSIAGEEEIMVCELKTEICPPVDTEQGGATQLGRPSNSASATTVPWAPS